jgi:opacity protein-like surface antigen
MLGGASLNKLTYMKASLENSMLGGFYLADIGVEGNPEWIGCTDYSGSYTALNFSQVDYLMSNVMMQEPGDLEHFCYYDGSRFDFNRAHRGWISDFDFNLSGNINDRVYLGLTVGLHNVNYKGYTEYRESLVDVAGMPLGDMLLADNRELTGSGVDVKVGAIFRPIEASPFRVGLYVNTPTWYKLESSNHVDVVNLSKGGLRDRGWNAMGYDTYEFKFYTPWKFGVSLGHTIGNFLALGATYEYTDCSSADIREELPYYDDYGQIESTSDRVMNRNVENSLKGVSTMKVGLEFKPDPAVAVRFGYNYVSPMYSSNGMRDSRIESIGVTYASTADYTNWKDTHRITCGLGYKFGHVNVDLAYQYSMTKGDFYPMQDEVYYLDTNNNLALDPYFVTPTKVDFKRHQVLLTLGYTF